jgi:hypothetical protein
MTLNTRKGFLARTSNGVQGVNITVREYFVKLTRFAVRFGY